MSDAPAVPDSARSFDDRVAEALRGFGPLGLVAILVIAAGQILAPLSAVLVLIWAWLSRTPWPEIGYVRPRSWIGGLVVGTVFGVVFKLAMKAVVMPLLSAAPLNSAYHVLVGNTAAVAAFVPVMIVEAGFGEETFFRGYLFERLGKLIGQGFGARVATVLATSLVFAPLLRSRARGR